MEESWWAALTMVGPAGMVWGLTVFNELFWPRGRDEPSAGERVSVLVPCRDEERTIEGVVHAVMAAGESVEELVVYDDGSTDGTPEILARLQGEYERLRVEQGDGLPSGWVGKPHACHQLGRRASEHTDVLLFLDADVELEPGGVRRVLWLMRSMGADVVTSVPRQVTKTFVERLVLPLLHLTYTAWLPLPLIWRTHDPRFLAANGQVLAVRREAYEAIGGFASVKSEVVDDMAFCRRAKQGRRRVVFADGHRIARCRMYTSGREVWEGFSKNLYEGIGGHPLGLLAVLGLYLGTFVAPYAVLGWAWWTGSVAWMWASSAGVGLNVGTRALLAWRHEQAWSGVLLHPVSVLVFCAIALNSWWWDVRGAIVWSGRVYAKRGERGG